MTWAQRLWRFFDIDSETCPVCVGAVHIIAFVEDPVVIEKILTHSNAKAAEREPPIRPQCRAPSQPELFD
jgi:hypothetical protein